ncbi:MAG: MarR family transcriptional regulator [Planctomycetota bacterium]
MPTSSSSQNEREIDRELRRPAEEVGRQLEPEIRTVISVVRTGDGIEHRVARLLREYGLTRSQYNVVRVLRDLNREMTVVELAEHMVHETPAMTGVIDRLERDGFVERKRSVKDRRLVYIKLCRKGATLIRKLDKPVFELHAQLVSRLSVSEQDELRRLLTKVRDAFPPLDG